MGGGICIISKANLAYALIYCMVIIQITSSQLPDWNYCDGNIWTPDNNDLYDNQTSLTSGMIKCGATSCIYGKVPESGTISFAWKKSINMNPAYYINYSFYISGVKKAQCNDTDWKIVELPVKSRDEVRWVLSLESGSQRGRYPIFASGSAWIANISCLGSDYVDPQDYYEVAVMPMKGCLNDTYTFNISMKNVSDFSKLSLEIQNPQLDRWESFGEGKRISENLTFRVPGFSFIKPPFFGIIKFRFKCGNSIIGPFTGPTINLNILNIEQNPSLKTLSVDVITNICECDICLNCDGNIQKKVYSGCGNKQNLIFRDLNMSARNWDFGVCNE